MTEPNEERAGADRWGASWWSWSCVPTRFVISRRGTIHGEWCSRAGHPENLRSMHLGHLVDALADGAQPCQHCGALPRLWIGLNATAFPTALGGITGRPPHRSTSTTNKDDTDEPA